MRAILYTSNAGSTRRYAEELSRRTGLPVYALREARRAVKAGEEVLYLGWICGGKVQGYAKAAGRYRIAAVCAVGLAQTGTQEAAVRQKTQIPARTPVFTLQGDFDVQALHGPYRWGMRIFQRAMQGKRSETATPEEAALLNGMLYGQKAVAPLHLEGVLSWWRTQQRGGRL